MQFDNTVDKDLTAALNTTAASTGDILLGSKVESAIRHYADTYSPLYANINRKAHEHKFVEYRKINALPTAAATTEGAIADASRGNYGKDVVEMKYITTQGKVTGPEIEFTKAAGAVDAWKTEIQVHSEAAIMEAERQILLGDKTTNAAEFDGLMKLITQSEDAASAVLTLSILDAAIDLPRREPTHIFLTRAMKRRIWALLQAQQRFNDRVEIKGGFRVPTYAEKPIIQVNEDSEAAMENTILMPDFGHAVLAIGKDWTFERLGKTEDAEGFFIKGYMTLVAEGTDIYHSKISNVLAAPAPEVTP